MPKPSLLVAIALAAAPCAQQLPDLALVDAFPSQAKFDQPLLIEFPPHDAEHCYVVEQGGKVWRIPRDDSAERAVFADFTERCLHAQHGKGHAEEGLLGLAFDPEFATTGHLFVYYSEKTDETPYVDRRGEDKVRIARRSVIGRFDVEDGAVDMDSELRVLEVEQPWGNHNGGTIVFGPDGMLYVALGDGGARADRGNNGQNLGTLLGAVLRIDVRGASEEQPCAIPGDNPFVGRDGARGEIWAYGLRNPWRIAFDRETGDLWCGDVGQDKFEEVDRLVAGGNYGWPLREGFHEFPPGRDTSDDPTDLIAPVAEYPRSAGISVTGGYVYRGDAIAALRGAYVFGDFGSARVWCVRESNADGPNEIVELCRARGPIASFGEQPDGELLALCYDGRVYRLVVER